MYQFRKSKWFYSLLGDHDIVIADQESVQYIGSFQLSKKKTFFSSWLTHFLFTRTQCTHLIFVDCDLQTSFERMNSRLNNTTRFRLWTKEESFSHLKTMATIYHTIFTTSKSDLQRMSLEAKDSVEQKVKLTLDFLSL